MNRAIISQRITSILAEIERLNNALYAMNTTDIQRYPDNYEVLSTDAALRAERITCRLRHLIYATTSIKKEEYLRSAETMQGIEISENGGILEIKLPCLLPKRRQRQSTEFLLDPFTSALSDYAAHHTMPQFQHCVVCFSHIYAQELPERRTQKEYSAKALREMCNSYGWGFCRGLSAAFQRQEAEHQEWGLVMVVPQAVEDAVSKMKRSSYKISSTSSMNRQYAAMGYADGQEFDMRRRLEPSA